MLKSPEEYLGGLSFEPPESQSRELSSGEKIFIEKYLGLEAFERLPELHPENEIAPVLFQQDPPVLTLEIAEQQELALPQNEENFSERVPDTLEPKRSESDSMGPVLELLPRKQTMPPQEAPVLVEEPPVVIRVETAPVESDTATSIRQDMELAPDAADLEEPFSVTVAEPEISVEKVEFSTGQIKDSEISRPVETAAVAAAAIIKNEVSQNQPPISLKEILKNEAEIQMVSFSTASQLFLLPVLSIQEVLRHQELIKVPQAPEFVAGVINLRGHVLPVVHLSALLTNAVEHPYSERNFIIVCGTDQLKLGLIIDRINTMHIVPQAEMIWNVEAKLGEAAEFLCAIATIDEKVTGVLEPETIAQKILSS